MSVLLALDAYAYHQKQALFQVLQRGILKALMEVFQGGSAVLGDWFKVLRDQGNIFIGILGAKSGHILCELFKTFCISFFYLSGTNQLNRSTLSCRQQTIRKQKLVSHLLSEESFPKPSAQ